jgi:indole-3-glycerol phosphate synthase
LAELRARVNDLPAPLDPLPAFCASEVSIAEMKRQSPSKGALAEIVDPALLAVSTKPVVRR